MGNMHILALTARLSALIFCLATSLIAASEEQDFEQIAQQTSQISMQCDEEQVAPAPAEKIRKKKKKEASESSSDSSSTSSTESIVGDCNHKTAQKLFLAGGRAFAITGGAFFEWSNNACAIMQENRLAKKIRHKREKLAAKIRARNKRHYGELSYSDFEGQSFCPTHQAFQQKGRVLFYKSYLANTQFEGANLTNSSFKKAYIRHDTNFTNVSFNDRTFRRSRYVDPNGRWHRIGRRQAKQIYRQCEGRIEGSKTMQELIEQAGQNKTSTPDVVVEETQPTTAPVVNETTSGDDN